MRSALILLALLNGLALNVHAQSTLRAPADLTQQMRDDIARVCLPVQYQSGAEAYRSCVQQEIVSRQQVQRQDSVQKDFANLSFDDRYAVQQSCGTDTNDLTVRACTADQIAELNALPVPRLEVLSSDEQYVMQQTCFPAQSRLGAAAYRRCQLTAINSVNDIPAPDYSALSAVARNSLQLNCSALESELSSYRRCVLDGTADRTVAQQRIEDQPSVSLVTENSQAADLVDEQPVSVASAVRIQTNRDTATNASVERALDESVADASDVGRTSSIRPRLITAPSTDGSVANTPEEITAPITTAQSTASSSSQEPAPEPDLAAALPLSDTLIESDNRTVEPASEPVPRAQTPADNEIGNTIASNDSPSTDDRASDEDNLKIRFDTFKDSAVEAFNGLSTQGKLLLAAIIAMPIALWALLAGRRRGDTSQYDRNGSHSREDLKRRVLAITEPEDEDLSDYDDPVSANWAAEADSLFDEPPTIKIEPPAPLQQRQTAPRASAETHHEDTSRVDRADLPMSAPRQSTERVQPRAQQPGFAGWLHTQPSEEQTSLAIEFLIYWLAFGDERYEPKMKVEIFQQADPSNHDIVKRWVFKEDIHAFADVIDWLQSHTTQIQKEQIVRFLMALLVNGRRPTPVQNTVLRFLSDTFYLTDPSLEELFKMDFGVPLPQTPRVDRIAWWDKQDPDSIAHWNVRRINAGDALTRHAAQLGLEADASAEQIETAFHQAINRCNPDHFEHLREREHQLLNGRRTRLKQSRDELMEALA